MNGLQDSIEQSIRERGLLRRGEKVLVAVSGGVDSMVLLQVLQALSQKHSWRICVAHLNHQLRGRNSDADERLVVRAAKKLGLQVVVERAAVKKIAAAGKLSIEMAARKARHEFLARTAARLKISRIALAHHADDQVELFFLRLFRGSGSEGLTGMKWQNASPADPKIQLVRPLLGQSKEQLREYAVAEKIPFREDESNEWLDIQRNRIRRELLPLLRQKYQPEVQRTILRVMEILRGESEFANEVAERWVEQLKEGNKKRDARARHPCHYPDVPFDDLPVAIQRRCIHMQLLRLGVPVDFSKAEALRRTPKTPITMGLQLTVHRDESGLLHLQKSSVTASESKESVTIDMRKAGKLRHGNRAFYWTVRPQKNQRVPGPQIGREVFDAEKVGGRVVLRFWQPGDRFQPIGMARPVKLQDLFVNLKIPKEKRHHLIVAVTEGNEVFWVEGLRISEQFKLTPQTRRQLDWRWKTVKKNSGLRVSTHDVTLAQRKKA